MIPLRRGEFSLEKTMFSYLTGFVDIVVVPSSNAFLSCKPVVREHLGIKRGCWVNDNSTYCNYTNNAPNIGKLLCKLYCITVSVFMATPVEEYASTPACMQP